jgi:DNA-directed RNA polymerase specialized sigma24 family protein
METYTLFSQQYARLTYNARLLLSTIEGTLLDPADLVHEAYIRLATLEEWPGESSFLEFTIGCMKHVASTDESFRPVGLVA